MLQSLDASTSYSPQYATHIAANGLHASDDTASAVEPQIPEAVTAPPAADTNTAENHTPAGQLSVELVTTLQADETALEAEATSDAPPPPPHETSADEAVSEAEAAQIDTLKARDQEVRTHEQAHAIAGGAYASSPSYEYQTGPDGRQYAVGGEVQIDTAPIAGDPSATIAKMDTVIRAALAPAEPSAQDRAVAATASKQRTEAQAELNAEKAAQISGEEPDETGDREISSTAPSQSADPIINLFA